MLSRIANNLYWMGRYLERVENLARYINVHFYMALDAPETIKEDFIKSSILDMAGIVEDKEASTEPIDVMKFFKSIALDDKNPASLKSYLLLARENARGARDVLSGELWEAINRFYHQVNEETSAILEEDAIFSFTENVVKNNLIINSYIDNTLTHNEIWALINLGIHIERATQTTRILSSKFRDIEVLRKEEGNSMETFQCMALLRSTEALDMSKIHFKTLPGTDHCLEFLILNKDFPKSITYNILKVQESFHKLLDKSIHDYARFDYEIGRISSRYYYLSLPEIKKDVRAFLSKTLTMLYALSNEFEKTYLTY
jgi:uncharacterized alpha-E superfamily protein